MSTEQALRSALEALVQLKQWKDKHGKDEHYNELHDHCWNQAKRVLALPNDEGWIKVEGELPEMPSSGEYVLWYNINTDVVKATTYRGMGVGTFQSLYTHWKRITPPTK